MMKKAIIILLMMALLPVVGKAQVKGNMGNQNGLKAQADFKGDKAKHQRDTGYNVRIQHRHIADPDNQTSGQHLHFPKSHRRHGAEHRGNNGGQKGNQQGIV